MSESPLEKTKECIQNLLNLTIDGNFEEAVRKLEEWLVCHISAMNGETDFAPAPFLTDKLVDLLARRGRSSPKAAECLGHILEIKPEIIQLLSVRNFVWRSLEDFAFRSGFHNNAYPTILLLRAAIKDNSYFAKTVSQRFAAENDDMALMAKGGHRALFSHDTIDILDALVEAAPENGSMILDFFKKGLFGNPLPERGFRLLAKAAEKTPEEIGIAVDVLTPSIRSVPALPAHLATSTVDCAVSLYETARQAVARHVMQPVPQEHEAALAHIEAIKNTAAIPERIVSLFSERDKSVYHIRRLPSASVFLSKINEAAQADGIPPRPPFTQGDPKPDGLGLGGKC